MAGGLFGSQKSIWELAAESIGQQPKHKVFLSFYHKDDQGYRDAFEKAYANTFINKSVPPGGIDSDNSAEYISRLIREDYLRDASVLIVLVGPNTKCRKHVDWEISAALNPRVGGISGLIGLVLPNNVSQNPNGTWYATSIPDRLEDNRISGFAQIYQWSYYFNNPAGMVSIVQKAFDNRINLRSKAMNGRAQMARNTCGD
jgi:hypothetical protein